MGMTLLDSSIVQTLAASWPAPIAEQSSGEHLESATITHLLDDFDVCRTAHTLLSSFDGDNNEGAETNVALQFPDSLLHHAPFITHALSMLTAPSFCFYVLGDTSYGECCVDEVAAQHLDTHAIVHYGNACLSPTRMLPVLYVFPKPVIEHASRACKIVNDSLLQLTSEPHVDRVVILYDIDLHANFQTEHVAFGDCVTSYAHGVKNIANHVEVSVARLCLQNPCDVQTPTDCSSDAFPGYLRIGPLVCAPSSTPLSRTAFVWFSVLPETDGCSPALRNASMALCSGNEPCASFHVAHLCTSAPSPSPVNAALNSSRLLRKRFAQLNKAKHAERIGIVPGTLGVSGNVEVIERCKRVIEQAHKRCYVMLVGKPNPTKLANFPDIDVFVLVACPQNSLLDTRDYMQPVLTPIELEAALMDDGDIFSKQYSFDFRTVLEQPLVEATIDSDSDYACHSLSTRSEWAVRVSGDGGGADFLQRRSWQGLKFDEGGSDNATNVADLPLTVQPGQYGRASQYDREDDKEQTCTLQNRLS